MPILIGKSGRLATNASVASSIASIASWATTYLGRASPAAFSRIEPEVSIRIATAAPSPSSTEAWYGAASASARRSRREDDDSRADEDSRRRPWHAQVT